ncbi:MAG: hypothetical protein WA463_06240 [Terriglobales bacterium]
MKTLALFLVLLLSQACLAQRYTSYLTFNSTPNPDGSVALTTTVSYTFNDGSSCSPFDGLAGYDVPYYVQNNNGPWAQDSALAFRTGENMTVYTGHSFPSVTVRPGQTADLSVGVKLQQTCWRQPRYVYYPPYGSVGSFYGVDFIDGEGGIAPSPCNIPGIISNPPESNCPRWPVLWTVVPYAAFHVALDSEQLAYLLATPTNFQLGPGTSDPSGNLIFQNISWQSSSGNLSDLSACIVGEYVTYPGIGDFNWPSPPYLSGTPAPNPTISNVPATTGGQGTGDVHTHPGFLKPYVTANFNSAQQYRWSCSNFASGQWYDFADYTISRGVNQHTFNNSWYYLITKAGSSASVDPLP